MSEYQNYNPEEDELDKISPSIKENPKEAYQTSPNKDIQTEQMEAVNKVENNTVTSQNVVSAKELNRTATDIRPVVSAEALTEQPASKSEPEAQQAPKEMDPLTKRFLEMDYEDKREFLDKRWRNLPDSFFESLPLDEFEKLKRAKGEKRQEEDYDEKMERVWLSQVSGLIKQYGSLENAPKEELDILEQLRNKTYSVESTNDKYSRVSDMSESERLDMLYEKLLKNPNYFSEQFPDAYLKAITISTDLKEIQGERLNAFLFEKNKVDRKNLITELKKNLREFGSKVTSLYIQLTELLKLRNLYNDKNPYKNRIFLYDDKTYEKEIDMEEFHNTETLARLEKLPADIQGILDKMDNAKTDYETEATQLLEKFDEIEQALNAAFHLVKNADSEEPKTKTVGTERLGGSKTVITKSVGR